MPIVDILAVVASPDDLPPRVAASIANALSPVFAASPGQVWVRLHWLPSSQYAEDGTDISSDELPVFVSLLLATLPEDTARQQQALSVCQIVATCLERPSHRVHLEYAAAGRGRVAFGGRLLT